jgi:hypothetical protein
MTTKLNPRERYFLGLIYPTGTIAVGTSVGQRLYNRGLVRIEKRDRYGITPAGAEAIATYPEAFMQIGPDR